MKTSTVTGLPITKSY